MIKSLNLSHICINYAIFHRYESQLACKHIANSFDDCLIYYYVLESVLLLILY